MKIKRTFRNELLTGLVLVSLVPLMFCTVFMIGFFKSRIENDYEKTANKQIQEVTKVLESFFAGLEKITENVEKTKDVREYLYASDPEEKKFLYRALYDATMEVREYAEFALYSADGTCQYTTSDRLFNEKQSLYYGILKRVSESNDEQAISRDVDYSSGTPEILLRYARTMKDETGALIGYLVASIDDDETENILSDAGIGIDSICLFDDYWNVIYESDASERNEIAQKIRKNLIETGNVSYPNAEEHFYVSKIGTFPLYVCLRQREIFTGGIAKTMYGIALAVGIVSFVLCLVASYLLSLYLNKPVEKLNGAMKSVEEGNLDVELHTTRTDEFGNVALSFNRMTKELKNNIDERLKTQHELDEAHAATMQAQLNPHFLYNTLDTMKWVAKANDVPEVATMSSGLAKILRMSISGSRFITLREELEFVRSYMNIQQIRFSGRFEFVDNINEKYYQNEVPKLILQPLVENAIVHGFPDGETGRIELDAYEEDGSLIITITNNGRPIPSEMLEAINSHNHEQLNNHHGVINVDTIIRLRYGGEYGVSAETGEQTVLYVKLPGQSHLKTE